MGKRFTNDEDDVIRAHYPNLGSRCVRLLSRTKDQIRSRAKRLGVRFTPDTSLERIARLRRINAESKRRFLVNAME